MKVFRTSMRPFDLALAGLYASVLVPLAIGACASSSQPSKTPSEVTAFSPTDAQRIPDRANASKAKTAAPSK